MTSEIVEFVPSLQQKNFFDWAINGSGSCVLEAVAGSGKTTTILNVVAKMAGSSAILAYNKKIADEIKEKLNKAGIDWKKAEAGTVHSFGFRFYRKSFPNVEVKDSKVQDLFDNMFEDNDMILAYRGTVCTLVGLAKQRAIGVIESIDNFVAWTDIWDHFDILSDASDDNREVPQREIITAAQNLLRKSNRSTDIIDFNDMVYLPLIHKVKIWGYDNVFVDEAQDTNPARRALVRALVKKGGRVIAVGDRHQAIYGFTGADNDSLELIRKDFNAIQLPLTITYRCPKKVVAFAQQWVSHIQAGDSAPEGSVSEITHDDLIARKDLKGESAILCRVTKPLVELAFGFIRNKVACKVEGRDIGMNLKKLATRWKITTINALEGKLDTYLDREKTKLLAKKQEAACQTLEDTVDTVKVIMNQCRVEGKSLISDVVAFIDSLFADDVKGVLVLSTIHKSKGREWENVFWYDRKNTCPSKWARQAWQQEQEVNLMYVAATRAKENLVEVIV